MVVLRTCKDGVQTRHSREAKAHKPRATGPMMECSLKVRRQGHFDSLWIIPAAVPRGPRFRTNLPL